MSSSTEKQSSPPPDGGYGWIIVAAGVIINASVLPITQCFGIIFQNEFQDMGITAAQISFLLHLHNSMYCSLGLISSPLLKKYSYKNVAIFGISLMVLGTFLTTFATSYTMLLFTVSILVGIGQGILTPALYLATNTYFKKRLTLAISFSVTGTSLSPIFMPQVCNLLLNLYGTKFTVLILSALSLHAFVGALLLRPLKRKKIQVQESEQMLSVIEKNEVQINGNVKEEELQETLITHSNGVYKETTTPQKPPETIWTKLVSIFDLDLLKQRSYLIVIIGTGISFVSELNIVLMVPFVLAEFAGFNREEIGDFLSVHYAADMAGRLAVPLVAYRGGYSPKVMYAISLIGSSVGRTGIVVFRDSKILIVYVISILLGLCKGSKAVFQSLIIPRYVSLEKLPAATGLSMVLNGLLSLIIGPIIGVVHDVNKSYSHALHTASAMSISCVILWVVDGFMRRKNVKEQSLQVANN